MKDFTELTRRNFLLGLVTLSATKVFARELESRKPVKPFSFAFLTDCYLTTGVADSFKQTQESQLFLQDAIKQINSQAVDFVLFGGNQVEFTGQDDRNWQLFIDLVQQLNCPWYFVLGDRDVQGIDKLGTFGPDFKGKGLSGKTPYWSLNALPNVHLIGLDTSQADSSLGQISKSQLIWLQEDLDNNRGLLTIVVSHHPLLLPSSYANLLAASASAEAEQCRSILESSNDVVLQLSGHVNVTKVSREKHIWYISSPGLAIYPCSYRIFRIEGENIAMRTHQVGFPALVKKARTNLADSQIARNFNARHPDCLIRFAQGEHDDQNATLSLSLER
jgi:3',5'-cyclic AMP phosphodiesterase CpdA